MRITKDELIENIELLAIECDKLKADLAQRTAERDEARRIACSAYAEWRRDLATERNWDCWKKEVEP
jgi:hypothetical protein